MIRRRTLIGQMAAGLALASWRQAAAQDADPRVEMPPDDPLMVPLIAAYRALTSYSDTGTVETTYQWPGTEASKETFSFETAFRAPRNFFFRFAGSAASGGDEYVVWCDGGPFQSWWKATGIHEIYDGGRGALAFSLGTSPTHDAVNLTAPFFFPQAELSGPATKLLEVARDPETSVLSASGRQTGMGPERRPVTIVFDPETLLIARLELGTESGQTAGLIDTITYTMAAVANPQLGDERFRFQPPG